MRRTSVASPEACSKFPAVNLVPGRAAPGPSGSAQTDKPATTGPQGKEHTRRGRNFCVRNVTLAEHSTDIEQLRQGRAVIGNEADGRACRPAGDLGNGPGFGGEAALAKRRIARRIGRDNRDHSNRSSRRPRRAPGRTPAWIRPFGASSSGRAGPARARRVSRVREPKAGRRFPQVQPGMRPGHRCSG